MMSTASPTALRMPRTTAKASGLERSGGVGENNVVAHRAIVGGDVRQHQRKFQNCAAGRLVWPRHRQAHRTNLEGANFRGLRSLIGVFSGVFSGLYIGDFGPSVIGADRDLGKCLVVVDQGVESGRSCGLVSFGDGARQVAVQRRHHVGVVGLAVVHEPEAA